MTNRKILCVSCAKQAERIHEDHLPHINRRAWWCTARAETVCDQCGKKLSAGAPLYAQTTWERGDIEPDRWEDKFVEVLSTKAGPVQAGAL